MTPEEKEFLLRYTGERFEGHRLPVDMLADLPAFRDLLAAFAKEIWHKTHADKYRVPKGFDKALSFDLVGIGEGSAIPALVWDHGAAQRNLPGVSSELQGIVDQAYEAIITLFDEAANDVFPKALSSEFIRPLNKFGAALRDDEKIEFWGSRGAAGNVVYIDTNVRRNLITKVRETYETRFEGSGVLVGTEAPADTPNGIVRVKTTRYGTISIDVPRDRVKLEFDGHIDNAVQFELTVELSSDDQFRGVIAVHDIVLIEFPAGWDKLSARLAEFGNFPDRWLDGSGKRISARARDAALSCVLNRPLLGPLVKVFPTEEGGVLLEFEHLGWDLSLEFMPDGNAEIYGIEIDGEGSIEPVRAGSVGTEFFAKLDKLLALEDE